MVFETVFTVFTPEKPREVNLVQEKPLDKALRDAENKIETSRFLNDDPENNEKEFFINWLQDSAEEIGNLAIFHSRSTEINGIILDVTVVNNRFDLTITLKFPEES